MSEALCGNLAKALATARDRCRPAEKGSTNQYHKYAYASAEEIITVANDAMRDTGLALVSLSDEMKTTEHGAILDRLWMLCHTSGESVKIRTTGWPVIPERGRPLDKALAAALTTSLSYKLRDMLQIPRVAPEDDIASRDDRDHEPRHEQPKSNDNQQPKPSSRPASEPGITPDYASLILDLIVRSKKNEADACKWASGNTVNSVQELSKAQADKLFTTLGAALPMDNQQLSTIAGALAMNGVAKDDQYEACKARLKESGKTLDDTKPMSEQLSWLEARTLIKSFKDRPPVKKDPPKDQAD